MSCSTLISEKTAKGCSGKCLKEYCGKSVQVCVMAVCERTVKLFNKYADGTLNPLEQKMERSHPSLKQVKHDLINAVESSAIDQLLIVGSETDLRWAQTFLPEMVAKRVSAEIRYSLKPNWFSQPQQLAQELQRLFNP